MALREVFGFGFPQVAVAVGTTAEVDQMLMSFEDEAVSESGSD